MNPAELQPFELLQFVAQFFEANSVNYRVVGSMASMAYGEPRFTNDVDFLADLPMEKVDALCTAFAAPDYYVSVLAAREAVRRRFQFNIIHPSSGLKVDVIIPPDTEFGRSEMSRGKRISSECEFSAWFGSPEDVLLNKLIYFQIGGSEKHLRDIAGMMKLLGESLDRTYIELWADRLGVTGEWQLVCERMQKTLE